MFHNYSKKFILNFIIFNILFKFVYVDAKIMGNFYKITCIIEERMHCLIIRVVPTISENRVYRLLTFRE